MSVTARPAFLSRFVADRSGLALIEFAFTLPIVLGIGLYGLEVANLALTNLRVSQIALALADNASRVGLASALNTQQLREVDINDVLQAARKQGQSINLTTNGRITLSSLENVQQSYDTAPVQRIHWQRCLGLKGQLAADSSYNSSYGIAATSPRATYSTVATYDPTAGVDTDASANDNSSSHPGSLAPQGMGTSGAQVVAPAGAGVMFVEVNYTYQPLISAYFLGTTSRIHYTASFIVRDSRDFSELYNPNPKPTPSTCNNYTK